MARHETLAAVDLGSNSLHLFIGRVVGGQIYPLDSLREAVRLGAGLTADKRIDRATQARALETLGKFGERLRGFPRQAVRAVGTNALRVAKNAPQFLREARSALGFPIEVIAGREEARLIYLGVAHALPKAEHRRLVVDVGGGSTEFIIGTGLEPQLTESLYMGCVSYSLRYFADGDIDKPRMKAAELAARQELAALVPGYRGLGWHEAIASSGTARAIESILIENGYSQGGIAREGLERLRSLAIKQGRADPEHIPGLRSSRAAVFAGGLAILVAVFDELGIDSMAVSENALRHGVLYDLLGRVEHRDMRGTTVAQFMRRYHVEAPQAERVRQLALRVYDALLGDQSVDRAAEDDPDRQLLDWAARLAEVGQSIAHAQYHKHSAYVLSNADMPGFSRMEQQRLARIVLAHRGKLGKIEDPGLEDDDWRLVFALRLASLILRNRTDAPLPPLRVTSDAAGYALELPREWLEENPLTEAALDAESDSWKAVGMKLAVTPVTERRAAQLAKLEVVPSRAILPAKAGPQ
jgi:exopolyphosphatase/guanosine-5'-triphosphate,3'-diphosphate pyrophosphatase